MPNKVAKIKIKLETKASPTVKYRTERLDNILSGRAVLDNPKASKGINGVKYLPC